MALMGAPTPRGPQGPRAPVLEESPDPKRHQLQHGLEDEDDGEHVVAVLESLVQRLGQRSGSGAALTRPPASPMPSLASPL